MTTNQQTDEEKVKEKWPDAELSKAFAVQPDKGRRWMWCAMSSRKFLASRGKKKRILNIGAWCFSESEAWSDAARELGGQHRISRSEGPGEG